MENMAQQLQGSSSAGNLCAASLQVKFGLPLNETLHNNRLPCQLVEMIAYLAREGVTTTDIFRRPGSPVDLAIVLGDLTAGRRVNFMDYNFYTFASLTKKFLLKIPGGLFGTETENQLLEVLNMNSRMKKYEAINRVVTKLPTATQQLLSLLLGTWFRIVNHSEYNTMSSEAVAKSVAHCLFHSITSDSSRIQCAIQILQILIDDFSVINMLGSKNIQYFADVTRTRVSVQEKRHSQTRASSSLYLTEENQCCDQTWISGTTPRSSLQDPDAIVEIYPPTPSLTLMQCSPSVSCTDSANRWAQPKLNQLASMSAPDVNKTLASPSHNFLASGYISSSLNRFDNVKRQQLLRMKKRSHWFLSPNANTNYKPAIPQMTTSLSETTGAYSVFTTSRDLSGTSFHNVLAPNNGCIPRADLSSSSSTQQQIPVPQLEVTSPIDEWKGGKNCLPINPLVCEH